MTFYSCFLWCVGVGHIHTSFSSCVTCRNTNFFDCVLDCFTILVTIQFSEFILPTCFSCCDCCLASFFTIGKKSDSDRCWTDMILVVIINPGLLSTYSNFFWCIFIGNGVLSILICSDGCFVFCHSSFFDSILDFFTIFILRKCF